MPPARPCWLRDGATSAIDGRAPRSTIARMTNDEIVQRYAAAVAANDLAALARLRHRDWLVEWPQSGERVLSSDAFSRIVESYPGGRPHVRVARVVGSEDRWVTTPVNGVMRVAGSGDFWWSEWTMTYPDGQVYHCI